MIGVPVGREVQNLLGPHRSALLDLRDNRFVGHALGIIVFKQPIDHLEQLLSHVEEQMRAACLVFRSLLCD